jgi:anti-sigma factor RsiW
MTAGQNEHRGDGVDDLHAYVDGQLDAGRRAAVEAYLAANPERAAEVANWQRQNAALNTMFGPVAAEPIPARLNPRRIAAREAGRRMEWTRLAAAALLFIALGGGGGWFLRTATWAEAPASDRLIDGAVAAHNLYIKETRHAVEVGPDEEARLIPWLSNRLGRSIDAPDLTAQGFTLVGGRLLPPLAETGTGPAAQLMYQNATSSRVTVYITAAGNPVGRPYKAYAENGIEAYYWADAKITCTVVGDLPVAQMQVVAKGVYQQLTWRADPPGRS